VSLSTAAKTITTAPAPPTPAVIVSGDKAHNRIVMWAILRKMVWRLAQETFTAKGRMRQFHRFCFDGLASVGAQERQVGIPKCNVLLRDKLTAQRVINV